MKFIMLLVLGFTIFSCDFKSNRLENNYSERESMKNKLTKELHKAVNQQFKGFEVYFQPIIDMKTEKIHSMEALLRFECDEFGKISPLEFIPLLEESDLIIPVGRWVLDQALKAVSMFSNIKVQINMSYV